MTSLVSFTVDREGRLVVGPGPGRRDRVGLRLHPEGAELMGDGFEPVALPWDAYGQIRWVMDGPPSSGWAITYTSIGRGFGHGAAVHVSGAFAVEAESMYKAMPWWQRVGLSMHVRGLTGHGLPILARNTQLRGGGSPERETIAALCLVLLRRRELRAALADPARMQRLARDLAGGVLPLPAFRTGARRDSVDIINAMHRCGLMHPFARPLGDKTLPSLNDAVARTRAALDASPYRKGRTANDADIERFVRSEYLDVQPWPFAALLD